MKHRVSELDGPLLDAAVALAEGLQFSIQCKQWPPFAAHVGAPQPACFVRGFRIAGEEIYLPSRCWREGGPIIERERICLEPGWVAADAFEGWQAFSPSHLHPAMRHALPLIAAMRTHVASKFGNDVDLP